MIRTLKLLSWCRPAFVCLSLSFLTIPASQAQNLYNSANLYSQNINNYSQSSQVTLSGSAYNIQASDAQFSKVCATCGGANNYTNPSASYNYNPVNYSPTYSYAPAYSAYPTYNSSACHKQVDCTYVPRVRYKTVKVKCTDYEKVCTAKSTPYNPCYPFSHFDSSPCFDPCIQDAYLKPYEKGFLPPPSQLHVRKPVDSFSIYPRYGAPPVQPQYASSYVYNQTPAYQPAPVTYPSKEIYSMPSPTYVPAPMMTMPVTTYQPVMTQYTCYPVVNTMPMMVPVAVNSMPSPMIPATEWPTNGMIGYKPLPGYQHASQGHVAYDYWHGPYNSTGFSYVYRPYGFVLNDSSRYWDYSNWSRNMPSSLWSGYNYQTPSPDASYAAPTYMPDGKAKKYTPVSK